MNAASAEIGPERGLLDWPFFDGGRRAATGEVDAWLATRPLDGVRVPTRSTTPNDGAPDA